MKNLRKREVCASEISEYLGTRWVGEDFYVEGPATIRSLRPGMMTYLPKGENFPNVSKALLITEEATENYESRFVVVKNPELAFYRVINEFFMDDEPLKIDANADISPGANISRNVTVGRNSVIGTGVTIGANSVIGNNVNISGDVTLGKKCFIKDNAVIGSSGYHFISDSHMYLTKPCLGSIKIGDNVLIGNNTTIELPLFDETKIGDNVKIDDLVNIGSTCEIGSKTLIAAGTVLSHRVSVGRECFIGAGTVVRDGIKIGSAAIIGIGSVVISNVLEGKKYAGNPAREI